MQRNIFFIKILKKTLSKLKREKGLWLSDSKMPHCHHGDVLINIKKTAVCGTDLHIYNWDDWAQKTVPVPLITGHEFMGVVVEVGEGVTKIKKNDTSISKCISSQYGSCSHT